MKIISWNVNGIRAAYKKGLFDFIKKEKPEIFCLQETKIDKKSLEKLDYLPEDYNYYFSHADKKGYSGVATFVSKKIDSKLKSNQFALGKKEFDSEGRYVVCEFKDFILYNIYFPSGSSGEIRQEFKFKFLKHLHSYFKKLALEKRKKVIICGDYNICHQEIDIHHPDKATKMEMSGFLPEERKWFSDFLNLGFKDSYREINGETKNNYTWWSYRAGARQKDLGWRLDYFLTGGSIKLSNAKIHKKTLGSDHCPISIEIT